MLIRNPQHIYRKGVSGCVFEASSGFLKPYGEEIEQCQCTQFSLRSLVKILLKLGDINLCRILMQMSLNKWISRYTY